ncbi:hypothetical protein C8R44DRAFT_741275 [Mycena epipterygia]|nr:hypothetical protein C8R44DRAFT_741275 [Mycena epipterygia]
MGRRTSALVHLPPDVLIPARLAEPFATRFVALGTAGETHVVDPQVGVSLLAFGELILVYGPAAFLGLGAIGVGLSGFFDGLVSGGGRSGGGQTGGSRRELVVEEPALVFPEVTAVRVNGNGGSGGDSGGDDNDGGDVINGEGR